MMLFQRLCLLIIVSGLISVAIAAAIEYDVVVVGGGSSGTYAAVRLQQSGKSVALIEKECRLGGHTNTYEDSATGKTFEYGTQVLVNTTTVRDFFASLSIPLAPFKPGGQPKAVDFKNSVAGPAWPVVDANASAAALDKYQALLEQYHDDFFRGYHLPDPVPEDLLLPWGDFLRKYNLGALAYDGFLQFQGMGNILAQPTLYVMKLFNPMQVSARKYKSKVSEANHNMQALWDAAEHKLGNGSSTVVKCANIQSIKREPSCVTLTAQTPSGIQTIHAKKVLMTIPPTIALLDQFLDLTTEETELFSRFNSSYYWNAVLSDTGFPEGVSLYNYDSTAPFGIPGLPGAYYFSTEVNNLYSVQYSSPTKASDDEFISDLLASVQNIRTALNLPPPSRSTAIKASNNHSPFALTVSIDEIRDGFYKRLVSLQSLTNTFWTGANWASGSSSTIWDFTEVEVIPAILKSLE
ncbi:related to amine oxidase, flavin-containing superfamily [Rhynchosporium agropyri]|uniref:Related to amine oxidase, flavin-containing superfamily n=1 Tax=Rhynchosporium agropyri TaxID=914238 RepID=A0A1E1LTT7_9HELO|nr:related to amine oxidase, flavin-containing superfamily [Rhynchosporium agropyri]